MPECPVSESGLHCYRLIRLGPDGTDDEAEYRCEDCGSTDPEGDSCA
jgi:transposase-like protein